MTAETAEYTVEKQHVQERRIRALLNADPVWAAYALADLQPAYAPYSRWHVAHGPAGYSGPCMPGLPGLVMLFTRLTPPALFAAGDPAAVAAAMAETCAALDAPESVYMTLRAEHVPAAERYYDFSQDLRPMWRMALVDATAWHEAEIVAQVEAHGARLVRLTPAHSARIRALLAHGGPFAPDAFEPYQTEDGVFYGVEDAQGELLAVGGTHIVDWQAGIAAIGNMYTHPAQRRQGYGRAVLRAILAGLDEGGASHIILNVDQRNTRAKTLYEGHGFAVHCPYWEGAGYRRTPHNEVISGKL